MPSSPDPHRLYNSRTIDTYLKLLKSSYPDVDVSALLDYAGIKPYQAADSGHWFSQEQIDRFHEKLVELSGNPDIALEAGRYAASADALGPLRPYILGILGPRNAFAFISKAASHLVRSSSYVSRQVGTRKVEITVKPHPGVEEKIFQCRNRLGWFEAAMQMIGHRIDTIEHPQCLFRGDPVCRYFISWKKSPSIIWKTLRNAAILVLPLSVLLLAVWTTLPVVPLLLGAAFSLSFLALLAEWHEKNDLKNHLDRIREETSQTMNQISLNHDNALLANEIGRAIGQETRLQSILERVVQLLSRRSDFDRILVFLADRDKTRLHLHAECGFAPEDGPFIHDFSIPLETSSSNLAAQAFRQQKPVIIDNPDDLQKEFSPEGFRLIKQLKVESFLFCPIVCNGDSLGLLAADKRTGGRPLTQTDLSLLEGVGAFIGIALRNADLLENMALQLQQIREKDAELERHRENLEEQVRSRTAQLQEALQAAQAATQARTEFLANMSHEIRTPLHGALGLTELLLESGLDAQQSQLTRQIQTCSESLLKIITDILDFSKIEAKKMELEAIGFDLPALLREVADLFQPQIDAKGLAFVLLLGPDVPVWVTGDPFRLRQVLNNLVANAVKFTMEGKVTLSVTPCPADRPHPCLHFEVQDTGIGLSTQKKETIFNSFHQADGSTSREYGGTGLGTTIAKNLVELMGGQIGCDSTPGRGSTFWFDIPLQPAETPEELEYKAPDGVAEDSEGKTGTILVVEDTPINRDILRMHLEKAGHRVALAENGREALKLLGMERFDLILMDIQMPEMDGIETTRRIREGECGEVNAALPIVAMTANATLSCRKNCLSAGVNDLLVKPARRRDILKTIELWLSHPEDLPASSRMEPVSSAADDPLSFEEALEEFAQDRETLVEVLTIFFRDTRESLARMERLHEGGDLSAMAQIAHGLKGTSGQFFAWPLHRSAEALEEAVTSGDDRERERAVSRVRMEFQRLEHAWEEWKAGGRSVCSDSLNEL